MTQNLVQREAVEKLKEIVGHSATCLLGSRLAQAPIHAVPMQVQHVDDSGDLWFISGADSTHNRHIQDDPLVQLFFTNNSKYEYLTVFGEAEINGDQAKKSELWDPTVEAWFPDGEHDPAVNLIRVSPKDAHYWASRNGKVVTLVKMIGALVTGNTPEVGEEGSLRV